MVFIVFEINFDFNSDVCLLTKSSNSPRTGNMSRWALIAYNCTCDVVVVAIRSLTRYFGDDKISSLICCTVASIILFMMVVGRFVSSSLSLGLFSFMFCLLFFFAVRFGFSGVETRKRFLSGS